MSRGAPGRNCSRASRRPTDAADLQGCDLIIEAVFENRELKAAVTREAEPLLAAGGFFASNTSTLPISGLAQASRAPQHFVGIHFFRPVDKMKLVEIIRGQRDRRRDGGARVRLRAGARQDADRRQRLARLLHQPRLRHLRDGRRGDARPKASPAPLIEHAGVQRRHAGRPARGARRNLAVAVGARAGPDPRRPARPKARPARHAAAKLLVERMVKEFEPPGPRRRRRLLRLPEGRGRSSCGRS